MARPTWANLHPAQSADRFVDSIGISAPVHGTSPDPNNDGSKWAEILLPRLRELGVRHIRSDIDTRNEESERRIRELGAFGIVTLGIFDPRKPEWNTAHTPEQAIAMLKRVGPQNMMVEGPNEPDLHNPEYAFVYNGLAVPEQPQGIRDYARDLYQAVKADPSTKNVSVILTSAGHPPKGGEDLGRYCDFLNGHFYGPGTAPGTGVDLESFRKTFGENGAPSPRPIIVTETGDHTAVYKSDGLWQPGVPEDVQALNAARVPFFYFSKGIVRTYLYALLSGNDSFHSQANFGILRFGGEPKPAFSALKSIIALLKDPARADLFRPKPLDYTLGGADGVSQVLLQKRDGRYYLALWQNINSFDPQNLKALDNPAKKVTLTVNAPIVGANIFLPTTNGVTATQVLRGKRFAVNVPDHPLLIELVFNPGQLARKTSPALARVPNALEPKAPAGGLTARPIAGNMIANYGFEIGALQPWNDYGTSSSIVSERVFSGTKAVRIGGNGGKGGVNIGVAGLKPNTRYVLRAHTRLSQPGQQARLTVAPVGAPEASQHFSHTDYQLETVEFLTSADGSIQVYFWKDAGEGFAYADNFILSLPGDVAMVEAAIAAQELKPVGLSDAAPANANEK